MSLLRRASVAARIVALSVLMTMTMLGLALTSFLSERTAAQALDRMDALSRVVGLADDARYDLADLNGWQTAYAFDVSLRGSVAAQESASSRAAFLTAAAAARAQLRTVEEAARGAAGAADVASAQAAREHIEEFLALDDKIVSLYRQGSATQKAAADQLVLGKEIELFQEASRAVNTLSTSVERQLNVASAAAQAASARTRAVTLAATGAALAVAVVGSAVTITSITRPLRALRARLNEIAHGDGDLTQRLDETGSDELADVSKLFNAFVGEIADTIREVASEAGTLAASAEEVSTATAVIAQATADTARLADLAVGSSAMVSASVGHFSAGTTELGTSIHEIARNAAEAAQVAACAVHMASATTATVQKLGDASKEISAVVQMITSIAGQTNLLALNATIEAARAGDAGRGFAVVAGEVKNLAQATASATEDITDRILLIQTQTNDAVRAIEEIGSVISEINHFQSSIAGAVEEQTATIAEMGGSVQDVVAGTSDVTEGISGVAVSAQATSASVVQTETATRELAGMGGRLAALAGRFLV